VNYTTDPFFHLVPEGGPESPEEAARLNYQPGVVYRTDERGAILTREGRQQAAELQAIVEEKEYFEQEASEPLRPDVAAALEDAHERSIGRAKAQTEYFQELQDQTFEAVTAPAAKTLERFVRRRGRHYTEVGKARLKPGEPVFIREPSTGEFRSIGIVNAAGELPEKEIEL
jgi:hypothetical protein